MAYVYPFQAASETQKKLVWLKGIPIDGYDKSEWRKDVGGHAMKFSDHGDTNSKYGWEIDHKKPVSKGGTDDLSNLQPLYWQNNRDKGDTYPWP